MVARFTLTRVLHGSILSVCLSFFLFVCLLVCTLASCPSSLDCPATFEINFFSLLLGVTSFVKFVKVRLGNPAFLDCQPSDRLTQPISNVTWWSGTTLIPEQSKTFSVLENGTLAIMAAEYFLRGLYSCSVGETTTRHNVNYFLNVLGNRIVLTMTTPN